MTQKKTEMSDMLKQTEESNGSLPSRSSKTIHIGCETPKWCSHLIDDFDSTDTKIVCNDGKVCQVHKLIVCAESEFLRTIVMQPKDEANSEQNMGHEIDVDSILFTLCLKFIYQGSIFVTKDQLVPLLELANKLMLNELKDQCFKTILKGHENMTEENCLLFWEAAFASKSMHEDTFFKKSLALFQSFKYQPTLVRLPGELIVRYLTHDDLAATKTEERLSSALFWTKHDPTERLDHLELILKQLPIFAVDSFFLQHELAFHPFLQENPQVCSLLKLGEVPVTEDDAERCLSLVTFKEPNQGKIAVAYTPISTLSNTKSCELTEVPFASDDLVTCVHNNCIFVAGSGEQSSKVCSFSPKDKSWNKHFNPISVQTPFHMFSSENKLYLLGQPAYMDTTVAIEVLKSETNAWEVIGCMNNVISCCYDERDGIAAVTKVQKASPTPHRRGEVKNLLVKYDLIRKRESKEVQLGKENVSNMFVLGRFGYIFHNKHNYFTASAQLFDVTTYSLHTEKQYKGVSPTRGFLSVAGGRYIILCDQDTAEAHSAEEMAETKCITECKMSFKIGQNIKTAVICIV